MRAELQLTEEESADIRREAVELLRKELVNERARALEDLISFSVEEFAIAKGVSVPTAKAFLTRHRVSKEKYGYRLKRFPLRELKLICDAVTIKGLIALRGKVAA